MAEVYIALGSNIGDRARHLRDATLALTPDVIIEAISPVYETAPLYVTDQPRFYNATLKATTSLPPHELLSLVKEIEGKIGRTPTFINGPRVIDLDILLYDDVVMQTPHLTIPHPRMHERVFVLAPLADIAPEAVHSILKKTIQELLAAAHIAPDEIKETGLTL